jgi:hypothetical protein
MIKIGAMQDGTFVSDEIAVTLDYDMMPNIVDVKLVPWFETR